MRDQLARPWAIFSLLISVDVLFIALHLIHLQTSLLPSNRWSIARDHGFGEIFQYLKYAGICLVLWQLFFQTRLRVMLGWLAVFVFLLLDDGARFHEHFGLAFAAATHLPDMGSVRARDIGELVFALLAGLTVLPLVVFGWLRGTQLARAISVDLALLLVALTGCGVGADLVHRMLSLTSLDVLVGLVEDGGEMLVLSLTCAYITQWMTAQVRFRPARVLGSMLNQRLLGPETPRRGREAAGTVATHHLEEILRPAPQVHDRY
jgi:hypothetical protein